MITGGISLLRPLLLLGVKNVFLLENTQTCSLDNFPDKLISCFLLATVDFYSRSFVPQ